MKWYMRKDKYNNNDSGYEMTYDQKEKFFLFCLATVAASIVTYSLSPYLSLAPNAKVIQAFNSFVSLFICLDRYKKQMVCLNINSTCTLIA